MRTLIFILIAILSIGVCPAKVTTTVVGKQIVAVKDSTNRQTAKPVKTEYVYTDTNGKSYPVYKGSKGSYFVYKVSKKGNTYKYYLPKEIQKQLK